MIKFAASLKDGGLLIGLGLTDENVARLKAGQPMHITLAEMIASDVLAREVRIIIFHGKDEDTIHTLFERGGLIGPSTEIVDKRNPH